MFSKNFSVKEKVLLALYSIVFLGLFLYSFTQVDLGLTFSRNAFLRDIVSAFQHIGYFERVLSSQLFVTIVLALTTLYCSSLFLATRKKIHKKFVWTVILAATVILTFSYNAFSYDLFNYIFDAKIITHYQSNPYLHKALDYPADPMLSFMHWTHRVYPYGPVWLGLTVPLSFIGLQIFFLTFFLFKLLMTACFIGTVWAVGKILQKLSPERELFGLIFFGLNPLVLIESLVSAHIDVVMMFFAVFAFYLLLSQKYFNSYVFLALSIGTKFLTGVLLPVFTFIHIMQRKKKNYSWEQVLHITVILLLLGVILESHQSGNFQPWYLLAPLSFAVLIANRYWIIIPTIIISTISLFIYVPYLYLGNYDPPVPEILSQIIIMSMSSAFCVTSLYFLYRQILVFKAKKQYKRS